MHQSIRQIIFIVEAPFNPLNLASQMIVPE